MASGLRHGRIQSTVAVDVDADTGAGNKRTVSKVGQIWVSLDVQGEG